MEVSWILCIVILESPKLINIHVIALSDLIRIKNSESYRVK